MENEKTALREANWNRFTELCDLLCEKYRLSLEIITWLLLGFHSSRGTLRKERNWEGERHQKLLKRMEEYIADPGLLLKDLFWFLYGKNNLPDALKNHVHEDADPSGFFDELKQFIEKYCGESSETCLDSAMDVLDKKDAQFIKAFKRVFFLFNPHYDERHGGLRDEPTPYQLMLNEHNQQCIGRLNELTRASKENYAEMMRGNIPDKESDEFLEIFQLSSGARLKQLSDEIAFFNLYAVIPEINKIVWKNIDLFQPVFSQKLASYYYWNALDSSNDASRTQGERQVKPIQNFYSKYNPDLNSGQAPDSGDRK